MDNVLGYYVYDSEAECWLAIGDHQLHFLHVNAFHRAHEFRTLEEANAAMQNSGADYVFACMGSP